MKTFPPARRVASALRGALVLVACALVACSNPNGLGVADYGTVTGRVVDTQSQLPISGATISIGNIVALTAESDKGAFILRNVPVGTQELRIDAVGWQRYKTNVTVTKNTATDIGVIALPSSLLSH
jgi:outer membrane receptor for ferrienterochelin and colicins